MPRFAILLAALGLAALGLTACDVPAYDYYVDAKPIIDANCAGCHRAGDIGPFALTTFDEIQSVAPLLAPAIENDTMPPWGADSECNEYLHDSSLSPEDKEILLTWLDQGTPPGDPTTAIKVDEPEPMTFDLSIPSPSPTSPTASSTTTAASSSIGPWTSPSTPSASA